MLNLDFLTQLVTVIAYLSIIGLSLGLINEMIGA